MSRTKSSVATQNAERKSRQQFAVLLNALTLKERAQLRGNSASNTADADRAQRRFERWSSQPPFDNRDLFELRLASDGIELDDFKAVLGTTAANFPLAHKSCPAWMRKLEVALSPTRSNTNREVNPEVPRNNPAMRLLTAVRPIFAQCNRRFLKGLKSVQRRHPELAFDPKRFADRWFNVFYPRVFSILCRTLVLELHVAGAEGWLEGNTPEERYQYYCDQLGDPKRVRTLFKEYPVLARQLLSAIEQRVDFGLEFAERLGRDWTLICKLFATGSNPGELIAFGTKHGDSHRGGRHVLVAEFESGLKLVYKPRSLAVDVHFQHLLAWFNERGDHPPLRILQLLDRGEYGWSEFVSPETCNSNDAVHRFYQRQGVYIALLYVLQATDFHSENLIAAGEHPVLVDLESLLVPHEDAFAVTAAVDREVGNVFADSVLRPGLLPHGIWSYGDEEGVDISGLGSVVGKKTPYRVPYFADAATDRMRLQRERCEMEPKSNRPTLLDKEVDLLAYRDALSHGFRSAYRTLLAFRDELSSDSSPLARFADKEVRPILRLTQNYALLLEESFHPDLMRDGLERDQFFDRLWIEVVRNPNLKKVIRAERDDLQNGDVPIFSARPNSTDLWTSDGERIARYFPESGLSAAKRCLARLGPEDFQRQTWLLGASLATTIHGPVVTAISPKPGPHRAVSMPISTAPLRESLISAAQAIGDRICQLAICAHGEANWLGLILVGERRTGIRPLQNDLYDGLTGVTLFLAHLEELTGESQYRSLAEKSLHTARRFGTIQGNLAGSIGGFDGWGGYIYTLTHLGFLWQRRELLLEAQNVACRLLPLIRTSPVDGVLGGTAGCLASLLALHLVSGDASTLDVARVCGNRLIETAKPMPSGVGWALDNNAPLCGFAHGAAGIAWALFKLGAATGDTKYAAVAQQAMLYERSHFCAEIGNWADLRRHETTNPTDRAPTSAMTAWCHGAPGIGLGRLASGLYHTDAYAKLEIEVAIDTTLREGFDANHSLCHGDLGNLELLAQASRVVDDARLKSNVDELTRKILNEITSTGWRCGVALHVEHPGLMTGLAGIGYALLRLSSPESIPSVLTLEMPVR